MPADATAIEIDLASDTLTKPTPAMRRAMAEAEVGDEQRGEDPTVNALCDRVAALLGKEAALFLPSGTMCNQIAMAVHCRPGDAVIAAENAHVIGSEGAGAAVFASAFVLPIPTPSGVFSAQDVLAAMKPTGVKVPPARLVTVEQTANRGGGSVWPLDTLDEVAEVASAQGMALHMDGARLMNAVVSTGVAASRFAEHCDSVWLDLSKGLGCPVGAVIAGSREFIDAAWIWKHRMGGAMRQAGIISAAGLHALDHHVERLAEDHQNARRFADLCADIPGVALAQTSIDTNIVFLDVAGTGMEAAEIAARMAASGVRIDIEDRTLLRAVTHLDVNRAMTERAASALSRAVSGQNTGSQRREG